MAIFHLVVIKIWGVLLQILELCIFNIIFIDMETMVGVGIDPTDLVRVLINDLKIGKESFDTFVGEVSQNEQDEVAHIIVLSGYRILYPQWAV